MTKTETLETLYRQLSRINPAINEANLKIATIQDSTNIRVIILKEALKRMNTHRQTITNHIERLEKELMQELKEQGIHLDAFNKDLNTIYGSNQR